MPIYGTPTVIPPPDTGVLCSTLDIVTAQTTVIDESLVLTKSQTHEVQAGAVNTLEFVILNQQGLPVDLTSCMKDFSLNSGNSIGSGIDVVPGSPLMVRFREALASSPNSPVYETPGLVHIPSEGVVRVSVPQQIMNLAGVYNVSWGVFKGTSPAIVRESYLFVTTSLFADSTQMLNGLGPPCLKMIRLALRDSSGVENNLLQRLEFDDSDLATAIIRPVREFNDVPPRLSQRFDTTNFPYQEPWLWAIQGYLLETAAHTYRRNSLAYNAGGLSVDDQNKEQAYLSAANYNLQRWEDFLANTKVALNAEQAYGAVGSLYGDIMGSWW